MELPFLHEAGAHRQPGVSEADKTACGVLHPIERQRPGISSRPSSPSEWSRRHQA